MISSVTSDIARHYTSMKRRDRKQSTPRPLTPAELAAAVGGTGHARYGSGPDFEDKYDNTADH